MKIADYYSEIVIQRRRNAPTFVEARADLARMMRLRGDNFFIV